MSTQLDPPVTPNPFADIPCVRCGATALTLVLKLVSKPLGTFSLSGAQMKTHAYEWLYCVCDTTLGGCGAECEGKL